MRKIHVASPSFRGNEKKYVNEAMDSGWISSLGSFIQRFEEMFAHYIGAKHAIAVSNGTVALHLALLAYDVKPEDEIIVPTLSYVATANAVKYCHATPVLVDAESGTYNIDVSKIEAAITPKTRGIIIAHLYGHPVDLQPVLSLAKKHGLFVVEDAAEALGARYQGKLVGPLADIGTFSFFGNKTITTGEGGMVVTNDDELAARVRLYKGQGLDPKRRYWHPVVGYNYRMTNLQAAIGLAQLEEIDWHLGRRQEVAAWYNAALSEVESHIMRPLVKPYAEHGYWMYTIQLREGDAQRRDNVMTALTEQGVETRPIFYPMHQLPIFYEDSGRYPVAEREAARGINLPTHAELTEADVNFVVDRLLATVAVPA